ncbi:hypothetical protein [Clostridium sp.]|uniref:hypothetical protein n=1 Tax=Clostridium sp. TaxID=1506 RepID=UPI001DB641CF|nr:hypothetical protein [Clostridium sp.]MBS4780784.1 hypothetical protein [Clostridium sp.]CAI3629006.1 hypothetical protein CNEO4_340083 [Clostridium neonatale]
MNYCAGKEICYWKLETAVSSRGKSKVCFSKFVERKTLLNKIKLMTNRKATTFNEYYIKAQ